MTFIAALIYIAFITIVIIFQFCLMLGAPWGHLTQGGQTQGALPLKGKIAAGASVIVLLAMAGGVISAAGLFPNWPMWVTWTALIVQALSTLANWATPSKPERLLWGPITTIMLCLALLVTFMG